MMRYLTSILTLYPGDVISSGTPDGVGAGRKPPEFLKPGDVVTIEIDGIGTLTHADARARSGAGDAMSADGASAQAASARSPSGWRWRRSAVAGARRHRRGAGAAPPDTILVNGHVDHRRRAVLDRARRSRLPAASSRRSARTPRSGSSPVRRRRRSICTARRSFPGSPTITCTTPAADPASTCRARASIADVLAAIAARVKQSRPGDVIVTNSDWHEAQLKEHRLPYRARSRHRVAGQPGRRRARRPRIHPQLRGAQEVEHHEGDAAAAGRPHHARRARAS